MQAAQHHLQRARALNPRSAEAAFASFKAEMAAATDAPDDAALQGVISAWQTARDVDALTRSAALAYAYAGKADEAYRTLGSLTQNPHDQPMAEWARQWQGRLETGVSRSDILAEMRRAGTPDAPLKAWTIDKQGVLQKVERSSGLEAAEAFIKDQQQRQSPAASPTGNTDRR